MNVAAAALDLRSPDLPGGAVLVVAPGEPKPKQLSAGVSFCDGKPVIYRPAGTVAGMQSIEHFGALAMAGREPLAGPLVVTIAAYRSRGMPRSRIGRQRAEDGLIRPATRPDCDNYSKACDALNGIVWGDDGQIVTLTVEKRWSARPRLEVLVQPWQAPPGPLRPDGMPDPRQERLFPWLED